MENESKTNKEEQEEGPYWKYFLKNTVITIIGCSTLFGIIYYKEPIVRGLNRGLEHLGLAKHVEKADAYLREHIKPVTRDMMHKEIIHRCGIDNLLTDMKNYHDGVASVEKAVPDGERFIDGDLLYKSNDGCVFRLRPINHGISNYESFRVGVPIKGIPSQFYPYKLIKTAKD